MWENLFDRMARTVVRAGSIHITYPGGRQAAYGDGSPPVRVGLRDAAVLRSLLMNPELNAGEAYMNGSLTIENDDLRGFLSVMMRNMEGGNRTSLQAALGMLRILTRRLRQANPLGAARRNVAHHYDLSGKLYDLFLDGDKQYSCAYFRSPDDTLEQAQAQKKAHIAGKLLLEPGMRILDIGCGWGGMALTLAQDYGANVLGVTLSEEQHKIATERAAAAGLSDKVEFRLQDYRNVKESFDRIVSVGMFEHVGVPHYGEYFAHVRERLNEDGVALIHTIGRPGPPGYTNPWILKYIFPGGYCPAMSEVMAQVEKQGLYIADVEVWRLHYAETLKHWYARFQENEDKVRELYDDRFCRMWRFYLAGSEMTFRHNRQCVFQFQMARRQEAVPLTRDYLYHPGA